MNTTTRWLVGPPSIVPDRPWRSTDRGASGASGVVVAALTTAIAIVAGAAGGALGGWTFAADIGSAAAGLSFAGAAFGAVLGLVVGSFTAIARIDDPSPDSVVTPSEIVVPPNMSRGSYARRASRAPVLAP